MSVPVINVNVKRGLPDLVTQSLDVFHNRLSLAALNSENAGKNLPGILWFFACFAVDSYCPQIAGFQPSIARIGFPVKLRALIAPTQVGRRSWNAELWLSSLRITTRRWASVVPRATRRFARPFANSPGSITPTWPKTKRPRRKNSRKSTRLTKFSATLRSANDTTNSAPTGNRARVFLRPRAGNSAGGVRGARANRSPISSFTSAAPVSAIFSNNSSAPRAGRGEAGIGSGPAGDLFLRVRLARHPDYRVEGDDLYLDLDLAPWEAVLGAQVSVPTLGGRIGIKIPPSAQNAQKMRIRGHGLPLREGGRGDLYVVLHVQVPERIGERERALWEQLARESRFNPRD